MTLEIKNVDKNFEWEKVIKLFYFFFILSKNPKKLELFTDRRNDHVTNSIKIILTKIY